MQGMPEDKPIEYKLANPSKQPLHANSIILQGEKDSIVPPVDLTHLNKRVVMLAGVGHFDWIHPGSMAFNALLQNLNGLADEL